MLKDFRCKVGGASANTLMYPYQQHVGTLEFRFGVYVIFLLLFHFLCLPFSVVIVAAGAAAGVALLLPSEALL